MALTAPFNTEYQSRVPGQATAGTDSAWNVCRAPYAGTVSGVSYTADAAIVGNDTNNRKFSLVNKGQAGSGTTEIAAITTTASPANGLAANDEKALALSGTAANRVVAEGDILQFVSDANSAGVVDPGGVVRVNIERS